MFEPDVSIAVWGVDVTEVDVHPEEAETVRRAVEKRRVEFARGRSCVRAALVAAGGPAAPVLVGPSREPLFPSGFVGSITHCEGLVAAAVARGGPARLSTEGAGLAGLGIDAEEAQRLTPEIVDMVVTGYERPTASDSEEACVTFSAKEALFKAVFPLSGAWLGFREVGLDVSGSRFSVGWTADSVDEEVSASLERLEGRWRRVGGLVLTACWVPVG